MVALVDRYHPARKELPKLVANRRAFGQATIRHAVFGIVLGLLEDALNGPRQPWAWSTILINFPELRIPR